jgi:hypothetical protein
MLPRVQARAFCAALRQVGAATVAHAELPNASRVFDLLATVRCQLVAQAVPISWEWCMGVTWRQRFAIVTSSVCVVDVLVIAVQDTENQIKDHLLGGRAAAVQITPQQLPDHDVCRRF